VGNKLQPGSGAKRLYLLQIFKQHNDDFEEMKNTGLRANSTLQKYKDVYLHLEAFIKKRYNRKDIALIELTPAFPAMITHG
jgi:hypothetical protein